nr:alpha/beta hydrolase fold [Streptococcus thermophilus]
MPDQHDHPGQPYRAAQERMRHTPTPEEPATPLPAGEAGPLNDQGSPEFNVGGVERTLSPKEQLEQLVSYMDATYPAPDTTPPWAGGSGDPAEADRYMGHLADRITHASMLMLGSGLDHTMPGVAYGMNIAKVRDLPALSDIPDTPGEPELLARVFVPSSPTRRWAVSLHPGGWWRGSGVALEQRWRPEVAAAAELSGTTILDLDYPLLPDATLDDVVTSVHKALTYVEAQEPASVTIWGASSGAALAVLAAEEHSVDGLVLTNPGFDSVDKLPAELRGHRTVPAPSAWPRTLMQLALYDDISPHPTITDAHDATVIEYHSTHTIATPEESRRRIRDVAAFLTTVDPA